MKTYDVVIVGGGAAGLSASIYLKENSNFNILLIESNDRLGGILNQCIHHGFGLHYFKEELSGPKYAQLLIDKFNDLNIHSALNTNVQNIDKNN